MIFYKKYFVFLSLLFILSCQAKNPFYGLDEEDKTPPAVNITYPTNQTVARSFTMVGTAKDSGGDNTVLKIEVSLDNGVTWNLAGGTTNWSYTINTVLLIGYSAGNITVQIRATDTDTKRNSQITSKTIYVDNVSAGYGDIDDVNSTTVYHNQSLSSTPIRYEWTPEPGHEGYDVIIFEQTGSVSLPLANINRSDPLQTATLITANDIRLSTNTDPCYLEIDGAAGKKYYITVTPYDTASFRGIASTSDISWMDFDPPSVPAGLAVSPTYHDSSGSPVVLSWTTVSDTGPAVQSGVASYEFDVDNDGTADITGVNSSPYYHVFASGSYSLRVRSVDQAGNRSAWSGTSVPLTVNTTVPATVGTITIASDGGDGYQNAAELSVITYSWADISGAEGYDIQVIRTGDGAFDFYQPLSSALTAAWTPVSAGPGASGITSVEIRKNGLNIEFRFTGANGSTYQIQAKAFNNAGTRSSNWKTSPRNVMIDTTLPTTPALTLVNGITAANPMYSSTTANLFAWSVSTDSASGIAYYQISTDGGTGVNGANETGTSASRTLTAPGTYSIKVRVFDKAGNPSVWSAATVSLTVNSTAPGAPTGVQVAGNAGPLYYNSAQNPTVSWTAPAAVGSGLAYYQISLDNGISVSGANVNHPTVSASRVLALKDTGAYQVCVRAVDLSGNMGPWSTAVTVHVENTVPGTPTGLTVAGSSGPLYYNAVQNPVIAWTNPTDGAGSGIASYQISRDGAASAGVITNGGTHNLPLQAGPYTIRVRAIDNAGNIGLWSNAITVYVENTAPAAPTLFRVNGSGTTPQYRNAAGTFALSWTASTGDGSGSGVKEYRIYDNAVLVSTVPGITASLSLALGTYNLRVRTVDYSGNESGNSNSISVVVENTLPTFSGISTPVSDSYTNGTVQFTGFNGADANFRYYEYLILENGLPISFNTTAAGVTNPTITIAAPVNGNLYAVSARAVDLAGNTSGWVNSAILGYDTSAPSAPSITAFNDAGGVDGVSRGTVDWSAVIDSFSGLASYDLEFSDGTNTAVVNITVNASENLTGWAVASDPGSIISTVALTVSSSPFTVTVDFTYAVDTAVTVKIRATDQAGNSTAYDAGTVQTIVY